MHVMTRLHLLTKLHRYNLTERNKIKIMIIWDEQVNQILHARQNMPSKSD